MVTPVFGFDLWSQLGVCERSQNESDRDTNSEHGAELEDRFTRRVAIYVFYGGTQREKHSACSSHNFSESQNIIL